MIGTASCASRPRPECNPASGRVIRSQSVECWRRHDFGLSKNGRSIALEATLSGGSESPESSLAVRGTPIGRYCAIEAIIERIGQRTISSLR